jgi:hypothetical protein
MPFQATFGNASLRTFGLGATRRRIGANVAVQYLVVAGGGGSYTAPLTSYGRTGGGGAGGLRTGTLNTSGGVRLSVVVGAGGSGCTPGSNSSVLRALANEGVWSNVVSDGGGNGLMFGSPGGGGSPAFATIDGSSGGSGGGYGATPQWNGVVGSGAFKGYPPQGNDGGGGSAASAGDNAGAGGGGGAGGKGGDGTYPGFRGGAGGAALASPITGTPVNYAGGGAAAGSGGSGPTSSPGGAVNSSAPANGGGGAGGGPGQGPVSLNGGSGVIVLRSIARATNTVGSPTETQVGNDWVYRFTSSGEIIIGSA